MARDPDVVVIGSGPNGLTAACRLARAGLGVLVLEANPHRPGGAVGSEAATLPGFVHDVGAAFFPWARLSPAFRSLELESVGLRLAGAAIDSAHPAPDGSLAVLSRDLELSAGCFGSPSDGDAWRAIASWYRRAEPKLLPALLSPLPAVGPLLRAGPGHLLRLARLLLGSSRGVACRLFRSDAARRVIPGLGLHVDVGPDDRWGAGIGVMLALTATTGGYVVPAGGAQSLTDALVTVLERHGGRLRLGARVTRVAVEGGRAHGVELAGGESVTARELVVADTDAASLLVDLLPEGSVPRRLVGAMRRFPRGFGTFKLDWALSAPVPWRDERCQAAAVVHVGDDLDDLSRFTREVRAGRLPERPYLVVGQQSLVDPTRAPPGRHTLWAYSRVPSRPPEGWQALADRFADRVEERLEELAPGFRTLVLARRSVTPDDLERMDANLVGGDLGGGSNAWHRQLVFRPAFPWFRHRMPVRRLYLASSTTHPGAGVHGMCGWNAAEVALRDLGRPRARW